MPDENGTGGMPGGAATATHPEGSESGGTLDGNGGDDALHKALKAERDARKLAERQASELDARIKTLETDRLPAAERDAKELAEWREKGKGWESDRKGLVLREAVTRSAARLGFADPLDAFRLLDQTEIDWNRDGEPQGVVKALEALLKAKPYLASAQARPTGDGGGGSRGATPEPDMNVLLRRATGRST